MTHFDRKGSGLTKVWFDLGPGQWHPYESESLWAENLLPNQFRLLNTPFFAKGVSYLDVIFAEEQNGRQIYRSLLRSSGHSTYRIIVKADSDPKEFDKYWQRLQKLGCTYESAELGVKLLAVDVPHPDLLDRAYEALADGENAGTWEFEEGAARISTR